MTVVERLHLLELGWASVDVSTFLPLEPERGDWYHAPITAFLVEGPIRVLVDTGLSPAHLDDPEARTGADVMRVVMRAEDLVTRRLAELSLRPSDVDAVVSTHLDFDHCGGNRFFPSVPIYVQREHLAFAREHPERCPPADWEHPRLRYVAVDGEHEIFPGLALLPTPGHVPGHQSVVVRLPSGDVVVLAGDAATTDVMLEEERVGGTDDPQASLASIRLLKRIRERDGALVMLSHDAAGWRNSFRIAPFGYYS